MLLKTGLPTSLLTGTVVLLVLTSHVFRGPNNSVSKRNGPNEVVSFNASASKLAVYFGSKTSVHDSLLNVHLVNRSPSKRDEWSDAVAQGRKLYSIIQSGKSLPSPFQDMKWLTGVYSAGSHNSVGWRLYGEPSQGSTHGGSRPGSPLSSSDNPSNPGSPLSSSDNEPPNTHAGTDQGALSSSDNPPSDESLSDTRSLESRAGTDEGALSSSDNPSSDDGSSESDDGSDTTPKNQTPEDYEVPFNALNIPLGEDNQNWVAAQDLDFANCYGSGKQATEGMLDNYFNVPGRTIVAYHNVSPAHQLRQIYTQYNKPVPPDWEKALPFVSRLSDVLWIIWADLSKKAGKPPGNLKYIFRHNIITTSTLTIMNLAVNSQIYVWPGKKFTPSDDQFMALLATAHGKGVFNLLTQHPADLGSRKIESITVFKTLSVMHAGYDHMLFTLTD